MGEALKGRGLSEYSAIHTPPYRQIHTAQEGASCFIMSARRTPSTTSLSKYARSQATEEGLANRSLDFCNAFWGIADGGYDVLLTRVRGAARTTEELRAFWKERYEMSLTGLFFS